MMEKRIKTKGGRQLTSQRAIRLVVFPLLRLFLSSPRCSFDFESKKNFKYLPLQWKMTNADCQRFGKTDLRNMPNRWCVKFKLFEHVTFTHCAPSAYWQLLVSGQIISVNPSNGATQIDVLPLIQSGGLDQFLPLRSAFGQSGVLDVLNYL